jgi:SAM-dependent methyltransferase
LFPEALPRGYGFEGPDEKCKADAWRHSLFRELDRVDYTMRRYFVDEFHFRHVRNVKPGSRVLDLGGHRTGKRGQFDICRYDLRVVCVNLSNRKGTDVQADARWVPFEDGSFDVAICSELVEHLFSPQDVLREIHRLLRPGGVLLMCAPFLHRIHGDPNDYGRYTDQYWQESLACAGFVDRAIEKQGLFWCVSMDLVRTWTADWLDRRAPRQGWIRGRIGQVIGAGRRLALRWDCKDHARNRAPFTSFTTGFGVRAVK